MIKAKFSNKTKEVIALRDDSQCILCGRPGTTVHHLYFGLNANRGPDRNNEDQGCILDYDCHHLVHNGDDRELRNKCITYVTNLYDT